MTIRFSGCSVSSAFDGAAGQGCLEISSAARCPARTALSIVAGRPVSIQSPARYRPRNAGFGRRPRRLSGASENVARGSRTTVARSSRAVRDAGSASSSSSCARRISSSFVRLEDRRGAARHQRQMRRLAAEHQALVEHPLHRAARQTDERLVEDRPIEPEVDGHDRRRRHRARGAIDRPRAAPAVRRRTGRPARTTAPRRSTVRAASARRPPATPTTASPSDANRRGRARPDRAAVALDVRARRLGVHQVQRPGRQARSPPRADRRRTSRRARARTAAPRPACGG